MRRFGLVRSRRVRLRVRGLRGLRSLRSLAIRCGHALGEQHFAPEPAELRLARPEQRRVRVHDRLRIARAARREEDERRVRRRNTTRSADARGAHARSTTRAPAV
eukprot:6203888-Pleurochrysis_carterae.AAC.2